MICNIPRFALVASLAVLLLVAAAGCSSGGAVGVTERDGNIYIPTASVSDGKAHHFKVRADDGTLVTFFVLKSSDGVLRAAMDACDVCYQAGKGYVQDGDEMVCINCGQRFASVRINEVKGGCNPAPLNRRVEGENLVIAMAEINANSWYSKYQPQ